VFIEEHRAGFPAMH